MEKNILQQKLEIAKEEFPIGAKVCNVKIGTIGTVSGEPIADLRHHKIFLPVTYEEQEFHEDAECLFVVKTVKKGLKRDS